MQNIPHSDPDTTGTPSSPYRLWHTALLACAVMLVPVLLGVLFVLTFQKLAPVPSRPDDGAAPVALTSLATDTNNDVAHLAACRRDLRNEGLPTDEANLRIWATRAAAPEVLFRVPPPEPGKKWTWHLSQDGRHAIAASLQIDAIERRTVGLYDLIAAEWVWKKVLLWPDSHEQPYVFGRHTVLRYSTHGKRFALELSPSGDILQIDFLGAGTFVVSQPPPPNPVCPSEPVAIRNNVFFVTDTQRETLLGYALERLPGLRYAGRTDANTLFSGNGRLKFTVRDGTVTVADSLTQTRLQQFSVWRPATNTVVTGALTTLDGSSVTVFLKTSFAGSPQVTREWSVALALHTGKVLQSFNADALFAKPQAVAHPRLETRSPDGQWELSLSSSNELSVTGCGQKRVLARCDLANLLGLQKPFDHIAFLEEGRHAVLRHGNNAWLLDFTLARTYADLLARVEASENAPAAPLPTTGSPSESTRTNSVASDAFAYTPSDSARLALRAERFAANQAWLYAAALLEESCRHPDWDGRSPRVNLLLLARYQLLSRQTAKARQTCRAALRLLASDTTEENRMIRYHLQQLLDAIP